MTEQLKHTYKTHRFVDADICDICKKKLGVSKEEPHIFGIFLTPVGVKDNGLWKNYDEVAIKCKVVDGRGGPIIYANQRPPDSCPYIVDHLLSTQRSGGEKTG